jgi:anhydro-N-acetylmuramic acid kinase
MTELYIGLMSGTSLDGVDGVLVDFSGKNMHIAHYASTPLATYLRAELLALNSPGDNELHRAALAANALARAYAQVVAQLLSASHTSASAVMAIGAHGQTVRHRPGEFDGDAASGIPAVGYTLQLNNPALLAELTGIDVVADFRSRDVAAGGQGAPLVPAFHRDRFGCNGATVFVLNIGGIANLSVLNAEHHDEGVADTVIGFDCGPGNALMDAWCLTHTGQAYDAAGAWAASGQVVPALLQRLLAEPFLSKAPPKSTGRDLFNAPWLTVQLEGFADTQPVDVQATLTEFTASACAISVKSYTKDSDHAHKAPQRPLPSLIVCGGGALNTHLMHRLQALLPHHAVASSAQWGLPPLEVEATAFAWLARRCVMRETGSLQSVTGARGARILGAIYPA